MAFFFIHHFKNDSLGCLFFASPFHLFLIGEAKNLLTEGEMNVSEISHALGFDNVTYFSRLFKKEVGITPNKFKNHFLN